MKIKKLMLPMMAFICAIGLAFNNVDFEMNPTNDYIEVDGETIEIDEVECGQGTLTCRVQLEPNGEIFIVYDDASLLNPKKGDGTVKQMY